MVMARKNEDHKLLVLEGFKSGFIKVAIDYDDVPHEEVEAWTMELIEVLNNNGF
jgi:hypothetical protein